MAAWFSPERALRVAALALLAFAYRDLVSPGTTYKFATGVEYWLFRPSDNSPLVIVALSLWLTYRRWGRLACLERQQTPWYTWGPILLFGLASFAWAVHTGATDLKIFSLSANIFGLLLLYWGKPGVKALWLPALFLCFSFPLPAPLLLATVWELQIWTAEYAGWLLYLLGEPALISGDQILRATQTFQVIEGCSGLRTVETLAMLTILMIDLFDRRGLHATILFALAPVVAFWLNGLRVLTLILNPHSEIVAIHNLQGIVILMLGLVVIYLIDGEFERLARSLKRRKNAAGDAEPTHSVAETDAGTNAPMEAREESPRQHATRPALYILIAVALVTTAAARWTPVWEHEPYSGESVHKIVGGALEEWPSTKIEPDFIFRGSTRFRWVVERRYVLEDGPVNLFVAVSDLAERGGSPLSPTTKIPGTGWTVKDAEQRLEPKATLRESDETERRVEVRIVEKGKRRNLVHHFYDNAEGLAYETFRSFVALDRSRWRRTRPIVVVRLATEMASRDLREIALAEARLSRVYEKLNPAIAQF